MQYRFKTEQEFINEFGKDWKQIIDWTSDGSMNYLFGTIFPYDKFINEDRYNINNKSWWIYKNMLIENKIINYNPLKLIFN